MDSRCYVTPKYGEIYILTSLRTIISTDISVMRSFKIKYMPHIRESLSKDNIYVRDTFDISMNQHKIVSSLKKGENT